MEKRPEAVATAWINGIHAELAEVRVSTNPAGGSLEIRGMLERVKSRPCRARYQGVSGSDSEARSLASRSSNPAVCNAPQISDMEAISGNAFPKMMSCLIRWCSGSAGSKSSVMHHS